MGEGDGQEIGWQGDLEEVLRKVHDDLLAIGGGAPGEHTASFLAACARPFHSFGGEYFYKTPYERAAALFHGIICGHVFVDGNKRTGSFAAVLALRFEGYLPGSRLDALPIGMLGVLALEAAKGNVTVEEAAFWLGRIFPTGQERELIESWRQLITPQRPIVLEMMRQLAVQPPDGDTLI